MVTGTVNKKEKSKNIPSGGLYPWCHHLFSGPEATRFQGVLVTRRVLRSALVKIAQVLPEGYDVKRLLLGQRKTVAP